VQAFSDGDYRCFGVLHHIFGEDYRFSESVNFSKNTSFGSLGTLVVTIVGSGVALYAIFEGGRATKHADTQSIVIHGSRAAEPRNTERIVVWFINSACVALDIAGASFVLGLVALVATAVGKSSLIQA
jgi:hypothetical protein